MSKSSGLSRPEDPGQIDRDGLAAVLRDGARELQIALDEAQQTALLDYLALLVRWNAVYNLTAVRDPSDMMILHLLDSLAVVPQLIGLGAKRLLDVGTGAGLPGIPLAIALPNLRVDLVDAVQKKVAFLTHAKGALSLDNIRPHHASVGALTLSYKHDVIVSRAFSDLTTMLSWVSNLLEVEGTVLAMKGRTPVRELANLPPDWRVDDVVQLKVPGLAAERCIVVVKRAAH